MRCEPEAPYVSADTVFDRHADELRREFRKRFLAGLRSLHVEDKLKLEGDWLPLRNADNFDAFLAPLAAKSWVTYIEPPPMASRPDDVVKYLARYLTGGPISDRRLVEYDGRDVTFTARTGKTHGGEGLERLEVVHRTSWRDVFSSADRPSWYRMRDRGG